MALKTVKALRAGTYDGHRRREGAEFVVDAAAKESWFVDVGPAPEGAELPPQIANAQAPAAKSFIDVMQQLKEPTKNELPKPMTLNEAHATGADIL